MPWTARLDGRVIDLRHETSADRVAMHDDRSVPWRCRGCDGPMHLRYYDPSTDRDTARFRYFDDHAGPFLAFVHNAGEAERCHALGFHTDESPEHLDLKHRLSTAAAAKGWAPETEVYHELPDGTRCRADVVITRTDTRTRVLEAQISPLGTDRAIDRSATYREAFGPAMWTHTKQRHWSRRIPSIRVADDDVGTVIGGLYADPGCHDTLEAFPLEDALALVLPPDPQMVWLSDFGGFARIGAPPRRRRRSRGRPAPATTPKVAGAAVQECPAAEPLPPDDERATDPGFVGPDGPWCRFGRGLHCVNGDRCANPRHRTPSA